MTANPTVTRRNFLLGAALCATMLSGCNQGDGGQAAAEDQSTVEDELGADLFEVTP